MLPEHNRQERLKLLRKREREIDKVEERNERKMLNGLSVKQRNEYFKRKASSK